MPSWILGSTKESLLLGQPLRLFEDKNNRVVIFADIQELVPDLSLEDVVTLNGPLQNQIVYAFVSRLLQPASTSSDSYFEIQ